LAASPHDVAVRAAVYESLERVDGLPHGHVDHHHVVIENSYRGRVAFFGLQSPHETGRAVGEFVDRLECRDEAGKSGGVERSAQPPDVALSQLVDRHRVVPVAEFR
jgi:hypothetical protein